MFLLPVRWSCIAFGCLRFVLCVVLFGLVVLQLVERLNDRQDQNKRRQNKTRQVNATKKTEPDIDVVINKETKVIEIEHKLVRGLPEQTEKIPPLRFDNEHSSNTR